MLADGSYDVVVVDAEAGEEAGSTRIDVTVLAGEHKGEVVTVTATGLRGEPWELLAVPGTLVVAGGAPDLRLEA